jgi:hypothetical protein
MPECRFNKYNATSHVVEEGFTLKVPRRGDLNFTNAQEQAALAQACSLKFTVLVM